MFSCYNEILKNRKALDEIIPFQGWARGFKKIKSTRLFLSNVRREKGRGGVFPKVLEKF